MTARAVYKWSCPNCGAHYIDSSSRNLNIRTAEHSGVHYRTGQTLSRPPKSSIRDHAITCNHHIHPDTFNILGMFRNMFQSISREDDIYLHRTMRNYYYIQRRVIGQLFDLN